MGVGKGNYERTPEMIEQKRAQMNELNAEQVPIVMEECRLRQEMFLTAFKKIFPNLGRACKEVGIAKATFNSWKTKDADFRVRYQEVVDDCLDDLEQSLFDTAKDPRYSSLAIAILKAYRKSTWGEKVEHSGEVSMVSMVNAYRPAVKVVAEN